MYFDFRAFFKLLVTKIQNKVFEICLKKFIPNPNAYGSTFLLKQQQQQLLYSDKKFTFLEKKKMLKIFVFPYINFSYAIYLYFILRSYDTQKQCMCTVGQNLKRVQSKKDVSILFASKSKIVVEQFAALASTNIQKFHTALFFSFSPSVMMCSINLPSIYMLDILFFVKSQHS